MYEPLLLNTIVIIQYDLIVFGYRHIYCKHQLFRLYKQMLYSYSTDPIVNSL